MEQKIEHVRVNLNKELWRIDYAAGIARHLVENIAIGNNSTWNQDKTNTNNKNNKTINLEGVVGYNGDITQYLQDKGYTWEQVDEDVIKFRREKEHK